jgi:hypothetical protein
LLQPWHLIVLAVVCCFGFVLFVLPYWFICKKAGFSPWLALLNVIPLGQIILIFLLAFVDWPSLRAVQPSVPQG